MVRYRQFSHASILISGLLILLPAQCQEWMTYKPSLRSQGVKLDLLKAETLLSSFCASITDKKQLGLTCETRSVGDGFADITDNQFHPQSVIFGHFLDSAGEQAAVSGSSYESHPYHWGGTLLLTRRDGRWRPIWYKSGLITRSCEKAERPDGREILLCEYEDGGMGHRVHALYAIDLRQPSADTPPLVLADSFDRDFSTAQQQTVDTVRWGIDRRSFSTVIRTPTWQVLPEGHCGPKFSRRPRSAVPVEFNVTNQGVHSR